MSEPGTRSRFLNREVPKWLELQVMTNPVVRCFFLRWRHGIYTWEEMLAELAKKLLEINKAQADRLFKLALCENTILVMPDGTQMMYVGPKPKIKEEIPEQKGQKDE